MADPQLNTNLKLECILASLTLDNYKDRIDSLATSLKKYEKDYDTSTAPIFKKYLWLIENQLHDIPSIGILAAEFPYLDFNDIRPITDAETLADYIFMYLAQKKHLYLARKLIALSDRVRGQGISDEDTLDIYNCLSEANTSDHYESIVDTFKELYEQHKSLVGISFLSPELDSLTGGITPGQICTILGAPGSMKTTYSSNIAYNALKEGKNVLYLSLEEPAMQLYSKWLSRCSIDAGSPLPQKDIVQCNLDDKQKNLLFTKVFDLFGSYPGKLYILQEQDLPDYSITTFESKFKEVDRKAKEQTGHGIDLLVVDHIQLLKFAVSGLDTIATINKYVTFFRQMSLGWLHEKRQIAVILLSQANREGYAYAQKTGGQYLLQHVAEASEVERASSYIISVYTDSMSQITNQLTLCAVKLRGSPLPASVIPIFEDGSVYQVGSTNNTVNISLENNVDESHINLSDIDSMLGV